MGKASIEDSSTPSILWPWVQIPSVPSTFFSKDIDFYNLSLNCENKLKRPWLAQLKKYLDHLHHELARCRVD